MKLLTHPVFDGMRRRYNGPFEVAQFYGEFGTKFDAVLELDGLSYDFKGMFAFGGDSGRAECLADVTTITRITSPASAPFDTQGLSYAPPPQRPLTPNDVVLLMCAVAKATEPFMAGVPDAAQMVAAIQRVVNVWALQRVRLTGDAHTPASLDALLDEDVDEDVDVTDHGV